MVILYSYLTLAGSVTLMIQSGALILSISPLDGTHCLISLKLAVHRLQDTEDTNGNKEIMLSCQSHDPHTRNGNSGQRQHLCCRCSFSSCSFFSRASFSEYLLKHKQRGAVTSDFSGRWVQRDV